MGIMKKVGGWAFLAGVLIIVIVALAMFFNSFPLVPIPISGIIVVLGLIVGILNVSDEEVTKFIIAAIGLAVGSSVIAGLGGVVAQAFGLFNLFVAGAVFIPALKAIYSVSKD